MAFTTRYVYEKTINLTGSGFVATIWDNTFGSNIIYSGSPLLTAKCNTTGGFQSARSVASNATGKHYFEIHIDALTSNMQFGIANASEAATFPGGVYDNNGISYSVGSNVWRNTTDLGPIQFSFVGDTVCVAVDLDTSKIWFRTNAGSGGLIWNNNTLANQNPAVCSQVGGFDITVGANMAAGPYYAFCSHGGVVNDQFTANFGATAYAQSVPSGYSDW